jgi:hypothetical protein
MECGRFLRVSGWRAIGVNRKAPAKGSPSPLSLRYPVVPFHTMSETNAGLKRFWTSGGRRLSSVARFSSCKQVT